MLLSGRRLLPRSTQREGRCGNGDDPDCDGGRDPAREWDDAGADVIVTATGFKMDFAASIPITVDKESVAWPSKLIWNGSMIRDVPNMFFMWGYTNATWTLGAEATVLIVYRVLKHMERQGKHVAVPRTPDGLKTERQVMWKLSSMYASAGNQSLPKYGSKGYKNSG